MTVKKTPLPPICPHCDKPARLTNGAEIYPNRRDLWEKPIWKCDGCGAYVGCHPGSTRAIGTPANEELRKARIILHQELIDPLWKNADSCGLYTPENARARVIIRQTARARIYTFVGLKLGIDRKLVHVSMLTLDQCRLAWKALKGLTYPQIREFVKANQPPKQQKVA